MMIDLRIAQLLCSRVCHDLAGPAGAVNTGIEFLGAAGDDEALALLAQSGGQLNHRIAFYRLAFGRGGGDGSQAVSMARDTAAAFLAGGKVGLDWPDEAAQVADGRLAADGVKLLMNLVVLGVESLPRGGRVSVRAAGMDDGIGVALTAAGPGASLRDGVARALMGAAAEALDARTVAAAFARALAESLGTRIEVSGADGEVRFAVLVPAAAGAGAGG